MKTPYSEQNPSSEQRVDWGDALVVPNFYGRTEEQAILARWIVQEDARVVCVLGMGGIGKSALSVTIMHQLAQHFQSVLFRSLRDAPSCEALLDDCLQMLSPQPLNVLPGTLEQRLALLLEYLHKTRTLMVLDNLECLLQEGDVRGHFRPGFEGYELLLHRVIEIVHQSCVLFTTREKPAELRLLEGRYSSVHSLRLTGLEAAACQQFFVERAIIGNQQEQENLIEVYAGNPLALKIVTETIVDQFAGQVDQFLAQGNTIFGSINALLAEQFARLTPLEQTVLCWLAIMREPGTLNELSALLIIPLSHRQRQGLFDAVDSLRRRSLIESGKRAGSFTLQSVVLEYITLVLIAEGSREIQQHQLHRLLEHGLSQAHAKEYVRQTQERLLVIPLLAELQDSYPSQAAIKQHLLGLLNDLRELADDAQGYGPANLIVLLRILRGNLNGLDLSRLCIRSAYLQGVEMQRSSLSGSLIRNSVWTSAVFVRSHVAISSNGMWWATGGGLGQVCVWEASNQTPRLMWPAHANSVYSLAFSPDGQTLASGSIDKTVKLWNIEHGTLLWIGSQKCSNSLAFSPDGRWLASGGSDATIQLWDVEDGTVLQTLMHPSPVIVVAFSPDGQWLASGGVNGEVCLWKRESETSSMWANLVSVQISYVRSLAFAPDSTTLVSAHDRQMVRLWEVGSLKLLQTIDLEPEYMAWSPDGQTLACCDEKGIWLWDVEQGRWRAKLHGHTAKILSLAFTPDSSRLLSNSWDGTFRLWDVVSCQCVRVMASYWVYLMGLDWSPDGTHLLGSGNDMLVTIWDMSDKTAPRVLRGHSEVVFGTRWSPDGKVIASCGWDLTIRLWDAATCACLQRFEDTPASAMYMCMAWCPDGTRLACGTNVIGMRVWDVNAGQLRWMGQPSQAIFFDADWSPDGRWLAGSGSDGSVYLWEGADGTSVQQLSGHHGWVYNVKWSPDGKRLASCSAGEERGELFVWDIETCRSNGSPRPCQTFVGHSGMVYAVAWSADGEQLISGCSDGTLRWWDVKTEVCLRTLETRQGPINALRVSPDGKWLASCGHNGAIEIWNLRTCEHVQTLRHDRPYERLNITGIRGLNEAQKASLQALGAFEKALS